MVRQRLAYLTSLTLLFEGNRLKDMTLLKVTEFHTEWVSVCLNITSIFFTIAIFKALVK
jgi:hypothetical protein